MGIGATLNLGLAILSSNPLSAIFVLDAASIINHLQYVNSENSLGFDEIANSMSFGHLSAIFSQPKEWDDR
jgi:hypothetical protein